MEFKSLLKKILQEGMGRPRAKAVSHDNEKMDLNIDDIKSNSTKKVITNQHTKEPIERYYFKSGALGNAKAFYTNEESPTGGEKYKYGNGNIVVPKGSSLSKDDVLSSAKKYHSSSSKGKKSSKKYYSTYVNSNGKEDGRELDGFITIDGEHIPIAKDKGKRTRKSQWYKK